MLSEVPEEPRREPWGRVDHKLKTHPKAFKATWEGLKPFEYRKNDRDFQVGQFIRLLEWEPNTGVYTGHWMDFCVTYISKGPDYGIPEDYAVLGLGEKCVRNSVGVGDYDHGR